VLFIYDEWNREHVAKHGVRYHDAEFVIENARPPYPKKIEEGKFIVYGKDGQGRTLEVVFAFKHAEEIAHGSLRLHYSCNAGHEAKAAAPKAVEL
jgi:uncharacterized DUF497 family protein